MAEKNDFIRNRNAMIAIGVAFVVIVGFIAFTWLKAPEKDVASHIARVKGGNNKSSSSESEHYAQLLNHQNHTQANKAESEEQSYLSVLDAGSEHVDVPPVQAPPKTTMQPVHRSTAPVERTARQDDRQQNEQQKRVEQQTLALLTSWTPGQPVDATVSKSGDAYVASIMPASYSTSSAVQGGRQADESSAGNHEPDKAPNRKVVEDYTRVAGELETDLDSDENSVVIASIQSGQWEGAKVYADGYKLMTNSIDMNFTRMVWKGHTYTCKAKPVDSSTGRTSLSGDVNHHWFSRIVVPALAEAISKGGQIYEDSYGQTTVSDGVVIQDNEKPDNDQIVGAAIGGFGDAAAGVLKSDAGRIPSRTVTVSKGTTIGIQFLGAVYESDDADLKKEQILMPQTQPASQSLVEQQQKDNQFQPQPTPTTNDRRPQNVFVSGY